MKRMHIITMLIFSVLNVFGQCYDLYETEYVTHKTVNGIDWDYYTYSIVKDSVLMDKIVENLDAIFESDSLQNLIREEYFHAWKMGEEKNYMIGVKPRTGIERTYINEKFIPKEFNMDILDDNMLEVSVMIDYFNHNPYGKFYTEYRGKPYFFENKYLITPTKKIAKFRSMPFSVENIFNFIVLFFIYHDGILYLDPLRTSWESIYE